MGNGNSTSINPLVPSTAPSKSPEPVKTSGIVKIKNLVKNILFNPAIWSILLTLGLCVFNPIAFHLALPLQTIIIVNEISIPTLLGIALANKKEIKHDLSHLYNICCDHFFSEIIKLEDDTKIVLGQKPLLQKMQDILNLTKKPKTDATYPENLAVLSMLEGWEANRSTLWFTPAAEELKEKGAAYQNIEAIDFIPPTIQQIEEGVKFIENNKGKTIYVHCKAGKGRSAIVVACFLLKKIFDQLKDNPNESELLTTIQTQLNEKQISYNPKDLVETVIAYIKLKRKVSLHIQDKTNRIYEYAVINAPEKIKATIIQNAPEEIKPKLIKALLISTIPTYSSTLLPQDFLQNEDLKAKLNSTFINTQFDLDKKRRKMKLIINGKTLDPNDNNFESSSDSLPLAVQFAFCQTFNHFIYFPLNKTIQDKPSLKNITIQRLEKNDEDITVIIEKKDEKYLVTYNLLMSSYYIEQEDPISFENPIKLKILFEIAKNSQGDYEVQNPQITCK